MRENAPDAQIHFWFSPWNIAMLSRNSEEIVATLKSFFIDIFLQEFKIRDVKMVDNGYKLFQSPGSKPENGVSDIIAICFVEDEVEVEKPSDRILKIKVAISDEIWEVVSCYYPEVERPTADTDEFYELLD